MQGPARSVGGSPLKEEIPEYFLKRLCLTRVKQVQADRGRSDGRDDGFAHVIERTVAEGVPTGKVH